MIQAIMLIALGFLIASLFGVLLAPSLWSRAARLSKKRLESTLPLTLAEIEATQDQLRATFAVRVRRLESSLAGAKQKAANQLVDNSRLQMQIVALKDQIADLDLQLSERRNAATVLEQTITKRFPQLDREITAVKAQLQERSYELQDLTSKLARREEELGATQEAAASYQEELQRLHQVLEKSAADRSGRRVRKASQWDLEDYRAEYDRLNLELSKLRQQLVQFQDRDSQQVGVIKGELQKLAELILTSAQSKGGSPQPERFEPSVKRDGRRDRPLPWRQNVQPPMPLAARLKLNADTPPAEQTPGATPLLASLEPDGLPGLGAGLRAPSLTSPVLTILPEETGFTRASNNGHGEGSDGPKILQDVVTAKNAEAGAGPQTAKQKGMPKSTSRPYPSPRTDDGAEDEGVSLGDGARPVERERACAMSDGPAEAGKFETGNGVHHASHPNGEAAEASLAEAINLDSLPADHEDEKLARTCQRSLKGYGALVKIMLRATSHRLRESSMARDKFAPN